ncbi:ATP-binding protein [Rossellomorea vietnamensis]|uniref:ATP-binding protein n=1 Tax=Rossellomorea vietnamensis TaxID=218284 RepID=UPI000554D7B1|nr:ATP-binding protein [Rossellomorea vietnamensis]
MKSFKEAVTNIQISSRMQIVGERICEQCDASVPIIKTPKGKVSECLNCENLAMQEKYERQMDEVEKRKHEIIFNKFSIIPEDLMNASFNNYVPKHPTQADALKKAVWYSNNFGETEFSSLLFKGSFGVGKSHLSKAISDGVKGKGKTVIYIDIPSLIKKIRNTFGTNQTDEEIYAAIEKADLVIFDDLGAERVKKDESGDSWVAEVLFQMFTSRTNKHNVITTNCTSEQLRQRYGPLMGGRIVSRMMKGTKVIPVEGEDMRLKEF